MYFSPFSNACHLCKTNAPPTKNPKMTSLTLRPTYPILTTNFKSTTLLLKSSCGGGIQLKGTCRYGPGQLPSTHGYKPRTRAAIPLPPLVPHSQGNARSQVLPGDSCGSVPHFCQRCTHKRKKLYSPGKICLKHAGGRRHCLTGRRVFTLKGFMFSIFRHCDTRHGLPQVGHMPSTLCLNDPENIFT